MILPVFTIATQMATAAVPATPAFSLCNRMHACGIENLNLLNGKTNAECLANEMFDKNFNAGMDKTFKEIDVDLKTWSNLAVNQCQIRLNPGTKRNIKAYVQWVCDEICLGCNPAGAQVPVNQAAIYIRHYNTHKSFMDKSKILADAGKPIKFTHETKYDKWAPTFLNYL